MQIYFCENWTGRLWNPLLSLFLTFTFIFILEYYYNSTHSTVRFVEQRVSMNALDHSLSMNYALGTHLKLVPGGERVSVFSQSNNLMGHFFFQFLLLFFFFYMIKNDGHAHQFTQVAIVNYTHVISLLFLLVFLGGETRCLKRQVL